MDEDLREAFREIKAAQRESAAEVKGMIGGITESFNRHLVESAERWSRVDARAEAAHARIDAHKKEHDVVDHRRFQAGLQGKWSRIGIWVAVVTSVAGLALTIVLAALGKS